MNRLWRCGPRRWWAAVGLSCLMASALLVAFCLGAPARPDAAASLLAPGVAADDVDVAHSGLFCDGKREPVDQQTLLGLLGISREARAWSAGRVEHAAEPRPIQYLIAFRKPVPVGSVQFGGSPRSLKLLKADAKFPPDPADARQWQMVDVAPNQSGGQLAPLPPGTATRAMLLTDEKPNWSDRKSVV